MSGLWIRFVCYGILGWCLEVTWTAITGAIRHPDRAGRLQGHTYLWMFPIYGLIAPLYEPLHNALRRRWTWPMRALSYAVGIMTVEYATGWLLRRLTGACPWDYSDRARWHIHGLVRLEYLPAWATVGLLLEPVHDFLVRLTPAIQRALTRTR